MIRKRLVREGLLYDPDPKPEPTKAPTVQQELERLLTENPEWTNLQIAAAAGVSERTARRVRRKLRGEASDEQIDSAIKADPDASLSALTRRLHTSNDRLKARRIALGLPAVPPKKPSEPKKTPAKLKVTKTLARADGPLSITEISEAADVPRSSVQRIVAALESEREAVPVACGGPARRWRAR